MSPSLHTMNQSAKRLALTVVGIAALAIVLGRLVWGESATDGGAGGGVTMPSLLAAGSHGPVESSAAPASVAPGGTLMRPITQVEEALFVKGSLRGTDHPAWGTVRGESVKPNRVLRDRFDYYLLALNEASLAELTALVRAHAERDLGSQTATEIMAVWERYLQLQQHKFLHAANPMDPASMQAALQEHQQVRQSLLGLHWAQAFYGEDEQVLATKLAQAMRGEPTRGDDDRALFQPPPGADAQQLHRQRTARFGVEAAERLRALDTEQAQWEHRLAQARAEVETLRRDSSLSALQRDQSLARYLETAFPDTGERLRASGLLGL